jgi:hypothetical protein
VGAPGTPPEPSVPEVRKLKHERDALLVQVRSLQSQLDETQRHLMDLQSAMASSRKGATRKVTSEALPPPTAPTPESGFKSGNRISTMAPGFAPESGRITPPEADGPRNRDRRLAEVEANLRALLEEVRALKSEGRADHAPKPAQR